MSRYIGKRVSYPCGQCGKQITLSGKTKDDSANSGEVFCSEQCFEQFHLVTPSRLSHGSLFSGIGGFDLAAQWMGWYNAIDGVHRNGA
jgi:hypothetical protein